MKMKNDKPTTSLMSDGFSVRRKFNKEIYFSITKGFLKDQFLSDIIFVRKSLKIPHLDPKVDFKDIDTPDGVIKDSYWLLRHHDEFINNFELETSKIIKKYELPRNFYDWVDFCVLYHNIQKDYPEFDIEFLFHWDEAEAQRIGLTTQEKIFARQFISQSLGFKKRPPNNIAEKYKVFNQLLSISKNKKRTYRTLKTANKTLTLGKKDRLSISKDAYSRNAGKITYDEIISREYSEEDEIKYGIKKLNARLRKQKQRLLNKRSSILNR